MLQSLKAKIISLGINKKPKLSKEERIKKLKDDFINLTKQSIYTLLKIIVGLVLGSVYIILGNFIMRVILPSIIGSLFDNVSYLLTSDINNYIYFMMPSIFATFICAGFYLYSIIWFTKFVYRKIRKKG